MLLLLPATVFGFHAVSSSRPVRVVGSASSATVASASACSQRLRALHMQEGTASAYIEFIVGIPEPCVPDVKLTRSRDGQTGTATFTFDNPSFLQASTEALGETTGMYLKDSEGTLETKEVTATFTNGKPRIVKGVYVMKDEYEWDRFMRFMERYAEANGLGFTKA